MASVLYPYGKQALESAGINLTSDVINVVLVSSTSYTYSDAHQFYSSVSPSAVGSPVRLTSILLNSPAPGVFSAANTTFASVSGANIGALVIYKNTGNIANSPLLAYIDGLSITPNGGDILCTWDQGPNKIFSL
jgi:hypothetical protein